jgi:NitT/TauT family transport system ATP-binding protein
MVRWGQVQHTSANAETARRCYRPDLYRTALRPLSAAIPAANAKVEGALRTAEPVGATSGTLRLGPDGFFDGRIFDPDRLDAYLAEDAE